MSALPSSASSASSSISMVVDRALVSLGQHADDDWAYLDLWQETMRSIGVNTLATIDKAGSRHLFVGMACDGHERERNRLAGVLVDNLTRTDGRREQLIDRLVEAGEAMDQRGRDHRATTIAIRGFLKNGGRILVTPEGQVEEGGGVPWQFLNGTGAQAEECLQASRAYFEMRRRFRSDQHIKRAAMMLGRKTDHGWWVLEAARD